jgi:hypothetical protein
MKNVGLSAFTILWIISTGLQAQTVEDIEGNSYSTITFRTLVWMEEPLKTTKFNDGTAIPLVENGITWVKTNQPAYCWLYNDETKNRKIGAIYNWYAVETGKLCPTGWHVPTDAVFLDQAQWQGGTRSGGFEGSGVFSYTYYSAFYWTSTEETSATAYYTEVLYDGTAVNRWWSHKNSGMLVRCVKNTE